MRHDRCFANLLNRSRGEAMAESNKLGAQGAKDEGANKGAMAQRPQLQALRTMMTLVKHRPILKTTRDDDAIELA
jgi:hypothetical protein